MAPAQRTTTLTARLLEAVERYPEREALWAKGISRSYAEFYSHAAAIAARLINEGVKKGDPVAILCGREVALYESIFACILAGAVYTPLNPRFPAERNRAMLQASSAKALIADNEHTGAAKELAPPKLILADGAATTDKIETPPLVADDLCYLLFTSGSTGKPKGVPITYGNVVAYLDGITALVPVTCEDRLIQLVDVTFDLSAHDMFVAWTHGAALYSVPENAAGLAPRFVDDYGLTGWLSVPSTAALAQQSGLLTPGSLPTLRFSYFCGEALPDAVAEAWAAAANHSAVYNLYGPTEATIAFSHYRFDAARASRFAIVPIGKPFAGQHMGAFNEKHEQIAAGAIGELYLAGSQLSPGYWQAPEITAEKFVTLGATRWYRTGDMVRYMEDGGFHYVGRADQQTKIQGFRVELAEIEAVLRAVTGRMLVAAVALPPDAQGITQGVAAFLTGTPCDASKLTTQLHQHLPHYMVPKQYLFRDALPLNANGKTDYKALTAQLAIKEAS